MAETKYLTVAPETEKMPSGVPFIIGNELAERFSFYGMRAILVVFMTKYLLGADHQPDHMTEAQAREWFHLFVASAYFFPLFGAIVADVFFGKYLTIMSLSIVYCFGHLALALNHTRIGLMVGLSLIAIGSGGIKPCVSSNVGDQFGTRNQHLLPKVYGWFYFSVNLGSAVSMMLIPYLLKEHGPDIAFGTPGILMLIATVVFWLGRKKFVHVPPNGSELVREGFSVNGLKSIGYLLLIFAFVAIFWSLYDQCSSAWVLQAEKMDRHFFGKELLSEQFQAANPLFILFYIPVFTYGIYPAINRVFPLTHLRKIGIGFFLTALSFVVPAWVESQIGAGLKPTIWWQVLAYSLLIAGEIMVSITGLEFAYTQAPKPMKSMIMSFFLAAVSVGNFITAGVNFFIQNKDGTSKLTGPSYYLFFAGLMFVTAVLFIPVAARYRERKAVGAEVGEVVPDAQPG